MGLSFDPFDPGSNLRKLIERKAAFIGDMRVSEERDVGDGVGADEEVVLG